MLLTSPRPVASSPIQSACAMRHRTLLPAGRGQQGARYAVVVRADEFLALSTVLVSPTSTSARPASFRPTITLDGTETRILVEQTAVVDPQRLGQSAGRLDPFELQAVDEALALVLGV